MAKKKQKFTPEEKLNIVLEGIRGDTSVAEICRRYGIYHSDYYRWRDKVMDSAITSLKENGKKKDNPELIALKQERERLAKALLELTIEINCLKKTRFRSSA